MRVLRGLEVWRRGSESNRRIKVLQTSPLPLGYRAPAQYVNFPCGKSPSIGGVSTLKDKHWSGRRGSNPRHRPWQGRALPLSYSRSTNPIINEHSRRGNAMGNHWSDDHCGPFLRIALVYRPLGIFLRSHDMSVAHVDDVVSVFGGLRIVRDHQHSLAQLLVGLPQHLQDYV
jgi:hypothetical protein